MRTAAITLIITCVLGTVCGQTYWASQDGNDAWDGLSAVMDSGHGPKATIQAAVNAASNGDVVSL
jgi:hypothetical protein